MEFLPDDTKNNLPTTALSKFSEIWFLCPLEKVQIPNVSFLT